MRNWFAYAIALLSLSFFVSGCFGGGGGSFSSTSAGTGSGPASLTLNNASNETIMYVYFSSSSDSSWGPDRLGSNIISRGESFTITGIAPGTYDVRVEDSSSNYKEWRGQTLDAGGTYSVDVGSDGWARD